MNISQQQQLQGVFPILATCFHPNDEIDFDSQRKLIEFCIEGGVHGLVILANASEGHLLSDQEKRDLIPFCMKQVNGRVPIIVIAHSDVRKPAPAYQEEWQIAQMMKLASSVGLAIGSGKAGEILS